MQFSSNWVSNAYFSTLKHCVSSLERAFAFTVNDRHFKCNWLLWAVVRSAHQQNNCSTPTLSVWVWMCVKHLSNLIVLIINHHQHHHHHQYYHLYGELLPLLILFSCPLTSSSSSSSVVVSLSKFSWLLIMIVICDVYLQWKLSDTNCSRKSEKIKKEWGIYANVLLRSKIGTLEF